MEHFAFPGNIDFAAIFMFYSRRLICLFTVWEIDSSFFPRGEGIFLRHLVSETRGSSHKDKRRGALGKEMNRDLLARPYVSLNLVSTRRQILSWWTELKSTNAKRT